MKYKSIRYLLSVLLWGCLSGSVTDKAPVRTNGANVIYLPSKVDKAVLESAKDLAYWLEKAGAGFFSIETNDTPPDKGIRIVNITRVDLPNLQRTEITKNGQSFHLLVNAIDQVRITGTGTNSYINGIYTFLRELGFRWYMPGDNWARLGNVRQVPQLNKVYTPSFRDRMYAGSGGASAIPGIDPKDSFSVDYILWNKRNRFSVDYAARGHQGIAFYNANKDELIKHPEYFCNKTPGRNSKLNYDNGELVKLLIDWSLTQKKETDRYGVIGVDPADGSGGLDDCIPTTIAGVKTWSDKYFWLANQVATRLPANDKDTRVVMYAYNNHAAPPRFSLDDNVFPIIIPYAFQEVASPDNFIDLWARRMNGRPMGIYDYWNITQWSKSVPQFNLNWIPERLRKWKASQINSVYLESTYGKGPMGPAFWLASSMFWDMNQNFDSLYDEFLNYCFEDAATDVRVLYKRWSENYVGNVEPSLAVYDLKRAESKTKNPKVLARLRELKAYVHYLKLYEDHAVRNTLETYSKLLEYTLQIHHLRLVHTSALIDVYWPLPKGMIREKDKTKLAAKYGRIKPITDAQIDANFLTDVREAIPEFSLNQASIPLKNLKPLTTGKASSADYLNNKNEYRFYISSPQSIKVKAGANDSSSISVVNVSGDLVYTHAIAANKTGFTEYTIPLSKAGEYVLRIGDKGMFTRMQLPSNIIFMSADNWYDNYQYPLLYFFVPKGVREIVYWDRYGPGQNQKGFWRDPNGKRVDAVKLAEQVYKIPVEQSFQGRAWAFVVGHRSFKMINIPHAHSLSPFIYSE